MRKRFRIPKDLQKKTHGEAVAEVQGNTVRECIEALVLRFPDLAGEIVDERGVLLLKWMVYINNRGPGSSDELSSPVGEGDMIDLLPTIAGG